MTMFALVVTGRLVETQYQQVSETQFMFTIPDADTINHIVVFMTGSAPLPEGLGAQVYFSWPEPNAPPTWLLLGYIANSKPSAIFKISSLKNVQQPLVPEGSLPFQFGQQQMFSHTAQIGISIEPLVNIQHMTPAISSKPSNTPKMLEVCTKMLENFINYVSSFGVTQQEMTANPNETYVPMSKIQTWFTNFQRRLIQNPEFFSH